MKYSLRVFRHLLVAGFLTLITYSAAAAPLNVVATFSILADMTQRVGGDRVQVHPLVGQDADAHVYQPTPADAKKIAQATLVVANGFGFEGWIDRLIKSSGFRGKVVLASQGIKTLSHPHEKGNQHDHNGDIDPHGWQDLTNALRYVDNITQALSEIDPAGREAYQANATKYKQELSALDAELRASFNAIPAERRKVVTSHDAFAYFSRAYGISFISPVGVNTETEPSAADVGRIIKQIKREHIPAVFMESISDPRLLERIRQESGAKIGGTLYSDSLSKPDGPASTYLSMMSYNAKTIAAALSN